MEICIISNYLSRYLLSSEPLLQSFPDHGGTYCRLPLPPPRPPSPLLRTKWGEGPPRCRRVPPAPKNCGRGGVSSVGSVAALHYRRPPWPRRTSSRFVALPIIDLRGFRSHLPVSPVGTPDGSVSSRRDPLPSIGRAITLPSRPISPDTVVSAAWCTQTVSRLISPVRSTPPRPQYRPRSSLSRPDR